MTCFEEKGSHTGLATLGGWALRKKVPKELATLGEGGGMAHPFFCVAKRKNRNKEKKGRVSRKKLLKCCYQGLNVTFLAILERLEFKKFSCRPVMVRGPSTLKSISLALLH